MVKNFAILNEKKGKNTLCDGSFSESSRDDDGAERGGSEEERFLMALSDGVEGGRWGDPSKERKVVYRRCRVGLQMGGGTSSCRISQESFRGRRREGGIGERLKWGSPCKSQQKPESAF